MSDRKTTPTEHERLEWNDTGELDLGLEIPRMNGLFLRTRIYRLEPGGTIGWHTHEPHQAIAYILEGTLTEHSDDGRIIDHNPGAFLIEDVNVSHWHENRGKEPVVFLAADIAEIGR